MPVPAAVSLAPAALGFVSNAVQSIAAGGQLRKDKKELARLDDPFYKIQDEYLDNYSQSAISAQSGLTQQAKDLYLDNIGSGLGSSIDAISEGGGGANDIANLFSQYSNDLRSVAAEDSTRQLNNIRYFQNAAKDLAGQKTMQWVINEKQPHENKLKELTQRIAADKQNIHNGIQGMIGSAQAGVTSMQNNSLLKGLFGDGSKGISDVSKVVGPAIGGTTPGDATVSTPWAGKFQEPGGVDYANVVRQMLSMERAQEYANMGSDDWNEMFEMIRSAYRAKE